MSQLDLFSGSGGPPTRGDLDHELFNMLAPHIVAKFWIYHQANPHVFDLYLKFARELKARGRGYYGAKAIQERIRWHMAVETTGDLFKINAAHTSCYARLLVVKYPQEFEGFFEMRRTPGSIFHG